MADIKKLLEFIDQIEERKAPASKPNNPVAKNAMATVGGGGFGKHKDKKKEQQTGKEKHKGSFMRDLAETAEETKELRKLKESWRKFKEENATELNEVGWQYGGPRKWTWQDYLRAAVLGAGIGFVGLAGVGQANFELEYAVKKLANKSSEVRLELDSARQTYNQTKDKEKFDKELMLILRKHKNKINLKEYGMAEGEKLKEYGPQSTDPNAQSTNPTQQGGVTTPQQTQQDNTQQDPDKAFDMNQFMNSMKNDANFRQRFLNAMKNAGVK